MGAGSVDIDENCTWCPFYFNFLHYKLNSAIGHLSYVSKVWELELALQMPFATSRKKVSGHRSSVPSSIWRLGKNSMCGLSITFTEYYGFVDFIKGWKWWSWNTVWDQSKKSSEFIKKSYQEKTFSGKAHFKKWLP